MNSRLSKMNKNLASMHDEKEKANAMAKKVKAKIIICLLKKNCQRSNQEIRQRGHAIQIIQLL